MIVHDGAVRVSVSVSFLALGRFSLLRNQPTPPPSLSRDNKIKKTQPVFGYLVVLKEDRRVEV